MFFFSFAIFSLLVSVLYRVAGGVCVTVCLERDGVIDDVRVVVLVEQDLGDAVHHPPAAVPVLVDEVPPAPWVGGGHHFTSSWRQVRSSISWNHGPMPNCPGWMGVTRKPRCGVIAAPVARGAVPSPRSASVHHRAGVELDL